MCAPADRSDVSDKLSALAEGLLFRSPSGGLLSYLKYNMRAVVNYALKNGKNGADLTKDEVKPFLIVR